jgi:peptidylprolyl isomerase
MVVASVMAGPSAAGAEATASTSAAPALAASDWRAPDPANLLHITTTRGDVVVEVYPELAPRHVDRIRELARTGFYDGLAFHRVIDNFMAQGGDPRGDGSGGSDLPDLAAEFTFRRDRTLSFADVGHPGAQRLGFIGAMPVVTQPDTLMDLSADGRVQGHSLHCPGVASMARANEPNSANSQFFLMRGTAATLDGRYTAWGRILRGGDIVRALAVGEPPATPDRVLRMRVVAEMPEADRPRLEVLRTDSASFRSMLDQRRASGQSVHPCAIDIPVRVLD